MSTIRISSKIDAIRQLRDLLQKGDQRELARRMGTNPSRISDAFAGLVYNEEFLHRLQNEVVKLLKEREQEALAQ